MRIALYHGYELTGSGSNEFTRYLSFALAQRGHEVHVLCTEPNPDRVRHVDRAFAWDAGLMSTELFHREPAISSQGPFGQCVVHRLPTASVQPVYLTDKQRSGNVKSFANMSEAELAEYHRLHVETVTAVLTKYPVDVIHANHMLYQPIVAAEVQKNTGIPFVIYPHGSAIEYVLNSSPLFRKLSGAAVNSARGLISGNQEVLERLKNLWPTAVNEIQKKTEIVGVGVDTALFQPIPKSQRIAAIATLQTLLGPGGKTPEQRQSLTNAIAQDELPRALQTPLYDQNQPDQDCAKTLASIRWNDPLLLFVGSLTSGKGLQSLIVAMTQICQREPRAQLIIVGSGAYREVLETLVHVIAGGDETMLQSLLRQGFDLDRNDLTGPWPDVQSAMTDPHQRRIILSQGAEFADKIHFLGRMQHEQLRFLFPCVDLAVFPSVVKEAYPLVLMESLANGVLPVVTDFSGFADGLHELSAWLGAEWVDRLRIPEAADRRIQQMATGIVELLRNSQREDLTEKLRQIAVEQYDWAVRAEQMERAYQKFLNSPITELAG